MTIIDSYPGANGLTLRFDLFLDACLKTSRFVGKQVAFKRDTRLEGYPQHFDLEPKRAVAIRLWARDGDGEEVGVFQIWERRDGLGIRVEHFSFAEHDAYSPSKEAGLAYRMEIGH